MYVASAQWFQTQRKGWVWTAKQCEVRALSKLGLSEPWSRAPKLCREESRDIKPCCSHWPLASLLLLEVDVVISLVVVEPQDIKVDTTASLTMFTINPLAFARLRPSTLLEFVACSGFSLILCWTFYPHLGWNWEMQHVWKVLSFTWVLKVGFWLVWMEGVLIRGPDDKAISPKIGDKAPPRAACLHPLTTEVWSHIRDLHLRHGQRCQPLSSASSFRDSAKCLCAHCNVVCTLSKPVQQWTYSKQPLIYYAAGNILEFSSSVFLLLPILFTAQDKNHNGGKNPRVCLLFNPSQRHQLESDPKKGFENIHINYKGRFNFGKHLKCLEQQGGEHFLCSLYFLVVKNCKLNACCRHRLISFLPQAKALWVGDANSLPAKTVGVDCW